MQVNAVSNNNPNFQAKFVMDKEGLLREVFKFSKINPETRNLIYEFSKIGKDQEVEFVSHIKNYKIYNDDIIELFNRTTGRTFHARCNPMNPLRDLLKQLIEAPAFFKPDRDWQNLTGQRVVSQLKEIK